MNLLDSVLVRPDGNGVNELQSRPQTVEFDAFIDVHDTVCRSGTCPDWIVQESPNAGQDDLEDGQTTAEPFSRQQVAFFGNHALLQNAK